MDDAYKVYVTKTFEFEAAHHLPGYEGECANVHGHTYKLEVTVSGSIPNEQNSISDCMVLDFKAIELKVKWLVLSKLDHHDLNSFIPYPTAECLAILCFEVLKDELPADVKLESIKVWETSTSYAEYRGE